MSLAAVPRSAETWQDQVVEALVGLGWPARQAGEAVAAVTDPDAGTTDSPDVPGLLRAALRHLGRSA